MKGFVVKTFYVKGVLIAAGVLLAAPAFAQSNTTTGTTQQPMSGKQATQGAPTSTGAATHGYNSDSPTQAYKQNSQGAPTSVGPGTTRYSKQNAQGAPTSVGPGQAYKQDSQNLIHGDPSKMKQQ